MATSYTWRGICMSLQIPEDDIVDDTTVAAGTATSGTLSVPIGDLMLQASVTDVTFVNGPTFTDLSLSVEKPGSFIVDYDVPRKDIQFQFMNTVKVLDKPLNLTYTHAEGKTWTMLDGTLVLNSANKGTTIEPGYDFGMNSWNIAASQRFFTGNLLRVSYENWRNELGLEWLRDSMSKGAYKQTRLTDVQIATRQIAMSLSGISQPLTSKIDKCDTQTLYCNRFGSLASRVGDMVYEQE
ncbi:unnamed protein product [Dovyalis caffra]|uniref:Uncharacterized protein n=1 Tax=Dovyalis caffra TaxID=77055 RepID=A0AAV1RUN5_9ROSI|nr:unnamed protein product [Dovyalis caffra]